MAVISNWQVKGQFVAWLTHFFALEETRPGAGKSVYPQLDQFIVWVEVHFKTVTV